MIRDLEHGCWFGKRLHENLSGRGRESYASYEIILCELVVIDKVEHG